MQHNNSSTKDVSQLYEELRAAIDGGSESYTHEDALEQIRYWRDAVAAEREACARICERFMSAENCAQVIRARSKTHG